MVIDVTNELLGWSMVFFGAVGFLFLLAGVYTWPRGPRHRCPGPRSGPIRRLLTFGDGLHRGRCWYDLNACQPDESGVVCCPECGRSVVLARAMRDGRRLRLGRLGLLLTFVSVGLGVTSMVRSGAWAGALPNLPLVAIAHTEYGSFRSEVREELTARADKGEITGLTGRYLAEAVGRELRSDATRWNAEAAISLLRTLWPESRQVLEEELVAGDGQSRVVAGGILRAKLKTPTPLLLEATVREMHDDSDQPGWYLREGNAMIAVHYLIKWHRPAREFVIAALDSADPQQRMLAAVVAAYARYHGCEDKVVAILAWHLQDNEIMGDAGLAARALYELDAAGVPFMKPWLDHEDPQVRAVMANLVERIQHPDRTWDTCEHPMPKLTSKTHDLLHLELPDFFQSLNIPRELTLE